MESTTILGAVIMAGAPLAVALRVRKYKAAVAKSQFPSVPGIIVTSDLDVREDVTTDENNIREVRHVYSPLVEYVYTVGQRSYHGRRVHVLEDVSSSLESTARRVVDRYPAQSAVSVYYDPARPEDAFLEKGLDGPMIDWGTWLIVGIVFVLGVSIIFGGDSSSRTLPAQ